MSLSSSILNVVSGLHVNQRELEVISSNIINVDTPGYTRKILSRDISTLGTNGSSGVREAEVRRVLDEVIQSGFRRASASQGFADLRAQFTERIDRSFGVPGGINGLDTISAKFLSGLESLAVTPEDLSLRIETVDDARTLAQKLNQLSNDIQNLREEAEQGIADTIVRVNDLLQSLAVADERVSNEAILGNVPPDLLDARDKIVDELARYIDIDIRDAENGSISVITSSGSILYQDQPSRLTFEQSGILTPNQLYDPDPDESGVGTVSIHGESGVSFDAIKARTFRSGELSAYIELRDDILVEAQTQLDEIAHTLAIALSDSEVGSSAVTVGAQDGFEIDLSSLQSGNISTLTYTDTGSGETHVVSLVRVDDAAHLPLEDDYTGRADDVVVGIDFSSGYGSVATQIQTALGGSFSVSNPSGGLIQILDDGATGAIDITGLTARATATATIDGGTALPLFVDAGRAGTLYSGALDGFEQKTGFAGRIAVSSDILADSSLLVRYSSSPATLAGDSTRPAELADRLSSTTFTFSAKAGIGSTGAPFSGSLSDIVQQVITYQGVQSSSFQTKADSASLVIDELRRRYEETSQVSIDQEYGRLIQVQNAHAATAKVMAVVSDAYDDILAMVR